MCPEFNGPLAACVPIPFRIRVDPEAGHLDESDLSGIEPLRPTRASLTWGFGYAMLKG